jgi:hypothetical protein
MRRTLVDALLSKPVLPGLWAGVLYTLPTAALLGNTWRNTKPGYHGMDWIAATVITLPGSLIADLCLGKHRSIPLEAIIGLVVNSIGFYLIGLSICHLAERSVSRKD